MKTKHKVAFGFACFFLFLTVFFFGILCEVKFTPMDMSVPEDVAQPENMGIMLMWPMLLVGGMLIMLLLIPAALCVINGLTALIIGICLLCVRTKTVALRNMAVAIVTVSSVFIASVPAVLFLIS